MQVKKFEAPTIQEALETIKRELGPEAIILQTKKNKRGFGLMSKGSVEVTAAVSERAIQKKSYVENRLPEKTREQIKKLPADRQAKILDKYDSRIDARAARASERVELTAAPATPAGKRITATRYAEIDAPAATSADSRASASRAPSPRRPAPERSRVAGGMEMILEEPVLEVPGAQVGRMSVEEELRHLKRMVEELKTSQDQTLMSSAYAGAGSTEASHGMALGSGAQALAGTPALATPALQDAFEQLVINGVEKRFAYSIVKRAGAALEGDRAFDPDSVQDQIAGEIMGSTEILGAFSEIRPRSPISDPQGEGTSARPAGPVVLALVGPTGVGKTTTVAKLASEALLKRNLKVGLINLDSYKVAAFDQLGTYAKILNVPFRSVGTADEFRAAIQDFRSLDLVIVDTTGRSQRDPESLKEMQEKLFQIPGVRTQLVLSVTTRDAELYDMATRFSLFKPQGLIVSKLDEATIYGALYNVSQKMKLPLMYFTTGQRVPEDLEEATRERVAALILDL